jgi:hypothetical protein
MSSVGSSFRLELHGFCLRVLERMPAPAQQIKRWTGQPLPLAARSAVRRMPDGSTRDHCRSGAETLPGVPRRRTYTVVVGPWCEGYWRRIGPYRPSHASRYSACLPPSCFPPFSSSERPVGNGDNTPNKREGSLSVPTPHQSPLRVKLRHQQGLCGRSCAHRIGGRLRPALHHVRQGSQHGGIGMPR